MEFCLALPTDQKLQQGWGRFVLRRSMHNILPPEVQWRSDKSDLSFGFTSNLMHHHQDMLAETMSALHPFLYRVIVPEVPARSLNTCVACLRATQADYLNLYGTILLQRWLMLHCKENDFFS